MIPWQDDGCPARRKRGKVRCEQTLPGIFSVDYKCIFWIFCAGRSTQFPWRSNSRLQSRNLAFPQRSYIDKLLLPLKQPAIELTEYSGGNPGNIWILRIGTLSGFRNDHAFPSASFPKYSSYFQTTSALKRLSAIFRDEETRYFRNPHHMCKRYTHSKNAFAF